MASNGVNPDTTSTGATLTVNAGPGAPSITLQPAIVSVVAPASAAVTVAASGDIARGRRVTCMRYSNRRTNLAAVDAVAVNRNAGEIRVVRVCVAQDCGQRINLDGTMNQVEGGVIQTVSQSLMKQVSWDRKKGTSTDRFWAASSAP